MKKVSFFILCLLAGLLFPTAAVQTAALTSQPTHLLDSILPDQQPRVGGSMTIAPDPADGMPFLPGEEDRDLSDKAERGSHEGNQDAARKAAPAPSGERYSVGLAVLLVGLGAISVVLAIFYVFRGKNTRGRE